jgi:predicted nuclease of predicted toxin-antitoxin system
MKLLLDQNCSAGAAEILRSSGLDVVHTREVGLATADDLDIIQWCRDENRIVITLDADFHAHLALTAARTPSVVRIRIEGLGDTDLATLITRIVGLYRDDLLRGTALTVRATSVRVHALPLTAGK